MYMTYYDPDYYMSMCDAARKHVQGAIMGRAVWISALSQGHGTIEIYQICSIYIAQ
jgi:tagatose-1,6-bisphosphate aldolase